MDIALVLILLLGAGLALWSSARKAAETAHQYGQQACRRAGVQLLDNSVALSRVGFRRNSSGQLRLLRTYRFEYSRQGFERESGGLALLGQELLWISAPEPNVPA